MTTVAELAGDVVLTRLREQARALGFSQIGVADVDLASAEPGLVAWLHNGCHGQMDYMAAHGLRRARPAELVPGTLRVITARMDYLPRTTPTGWQAIEWDRLSRPEQATASLYARGRDYHKVLRARLQALADALAEQVGPFGHRVFTDSAPVLEVELAARSGIGWRGKHTLVLDRAAGSMFFLGEIYVDLALPLTEPATAHCGSCSACIDICPTQAIVGPERLDARRCISYLTIELKGEIPVELREAIGGLVYGCDICQDVCPWNIKFAKLLPDESPFAPREALGGKDARSLARAVLGMTQEEFSRAFKDSPMKRAKLRGLKRNATVMLGNVGTADDTDVLTRSLDDEEPLVREHAAWALRRLGARHS